MGGLPPITLQAFHTHNSEIDRQALLNEITSGGDIAVSHSSQSIADFRSPDPVADVASGVAPAGGPPAASGAESAGGPPAASGAEPADGAPAASWVESTNGSRPSSADSGPTHSSGPISRNSSRSSKKDSRSSGRRRNQDSRNTSRRSALGRMDGGSLPGFLGDDEPVGDEGDAGAGEKSAPLRHGTIRRATDVVHAAVQVNGDQHYYSPMPGPEMDFEVRRRVDTQYFWDNTRKIDMVLAYRDDDDVSKAHRRKAFTSNLMSEGLEIEVEEKEHSSDGRTYYMKVHSPWEVLTRYAEIMNLKMPIQEDEPQEETGPSCAPNVFKYNTDLIPPEPEYFTAGFNRRREHQFVIKSRETFFTAAQRSQIVWQILMRTKYSATSSGHERSKVGINRLLNNGSFLAAFPLHDGTYKDSPSAGPPNDRRCLYLEWGRPQAILKKQPLWLVRKYFGDKIGLYFAWLGFYTTMLVPAAIVGIIVFIIGLIMVNTDKKYNPSVEICDSDVIMCPLCHKICEYWKLSDSCLFSRITYLFDNPATVFFSIFMAFWATMFLEFWKRRQAVIAWEWDLANYEDEEDARPEFEVKATSFRVNPVTKEHEPYMPMTSKLWRVLASGTIIIFMLLLVVAAVFAVIIYRLSVLTFFQSSRDVFWLKQAKIVTSITAATLNLIVIVIMNNVYRRVAVWLTNLENPRTQTEYEDSFTFKMFFFQFVNYYSSLVYIAFFKNRFYTYPGQAGYDQNALNRTQADVCDPAGCLFELCIQLSIIMVGKQILSNFIEILLPKIMNWWRTRASLNKVQDAERQLYTRWEQDYDLQGLGTLSLFEEYLEMVIQYGFVTLFVAAFPLAPVFALINNVIEIRLDAYKYVTQVRRPLAQRVQDIGAWYGILRGITYLAVVFNAFVIAFTSDFIPRLVYWYIYSDTSTLTGYVNASLSVFNTSDFPPGYAPSHQIDDRNFSTCRYRGYRNPPDSDHPYETSMMYWHVFGARLCFVAVFEHIVIGLTGVMAYIIPDIPGSVQVQIQRERMLAREAQYEAEMYRLKMERDLSHDPTASVSSRQGSWRPHGVNRRGTLPSQTEFAS